MKWLVKGLDCDGKPRVHIFEAESEAEARASVHEDGWRDVQVLLPHTTGQVVADHLVDTAPTGPLLDAGERASAEPDSFQAYLLQVLATYMALWPVVLIAVLGLAAALWFDGIGWPAGLLAVLLLIPAALAKLGARPGRWYNDYRWAVARGDWPLAVELAENLLDVLEPNLGRSLLARAKAGAGDMSEARKLMTDVAVNEGFSRAEYLVHCAQVLTEGGEYEEALPVQLELSEEVEDEPTGAQAVAIHYALYLQQSSKARPYLDRALPARGRGRIVDLMLDFTEAIVRFEEGEREEVAPFIEALIARAHTEGEVMPEIWGLDKLLSYYACLATAQTDPERAATHFAATAGLPSHSNSIRLANRCREALGDHL